MLIISMLIMVRVRIWVKMRLMMKIFLAEAAPTDDYATAEQMLVRKEHGSK